ncbi:MULTISPECIES: CAP domain-containing protein [unclassified Streptomyces]|uniref:CAP domain-containing protein n=1 Tax=unclassified Streptomyces TaxID=2593676 RepID=UPI0037F1DCEB
MGRHRRSGAAPAAEDYAAGTGRRHRGDRRRRPVRTGLLGASAAVAVGAALVASGLLPGGDVLTVGSTDTAEQRSASRQAPQLTTQGGTTGPATTGAGSGSGSGSGKSSTAPKQSTKPGAEPSPKPSKTTASPHAKPSAKPKPSATPSAGAKPKTAKTAAPRPAKTAGAKPAAPEPAAPKTSAAPTTEAPAPRPKPTVKAPTRKAAASTANRGGAAEAEVLRLVNDERATVGCTPVTVDARLASLAGAFSADMAARGFFDHTDPDGDTPWARARQAGVSTLAGENIARGQADAAAVMKSWMNSDGHRANILNCDFKTMGVGVHFGAGGPWWTQDFGY